MGCVKQFSTLLKSFGEILPKVIKFCAITGTFCYSWETFIKKKQPTVVKISQILIFTGNFKTFLGTKL